MKLEHEKMTLVKSGKILESFFTSSAFIKKFCVVLLKKDYEFKFVPFLVNLSKDGIFMDQKLNHLEIESKKYFDCTGVLQLPKILICIFDYQCPVYVLNASEDSFRITEEHTLIFRNEGDVDKYYLVGASVHLGKNDTSGHYVYYKKNSIGEWKRYSYNNEVEMEEISKIPNILIYKKEN
ncbi:hypothetical protein TUBRATIS_28690 [Tubulinosema ratisbonensis]|uniref:Peptidase C19 ubiquitin carboxyl-terminal hydrolase domain-containing protein n=1 Tax=Tubulinosema ratisbonensis TaxID=291195 RepID=A0A437AHQ8_9MICR|nr:hypothetical protein TUBRATIS_28690 [Tubulinosema ratisbonensis]